MAHNYTQEYFRWRLDEDDVNSEASGWLAAENTDISHGTGIPVRLRIKVRETGVGGDSIAHKLQVKLNPGVWVDVQQDGPNVGITSPVLLVGSPNFSDGATITTEYLTSTVGNVNGEGIAPAHETNSITAAYSPNNQEIEFEWNLKIMSFHDDFIQVIENDLLQFRMVESDGTLYDTYDVIPEITAIETDYYVGGTVAETPDRLIASDSNGNIYYFLEPSESTQDIICIKSADGGKTWREIDGVHRPANNDMESGDIQVVGDTIHLGMQHNDDAYYHRFHMSDHSTTPDTWAITDEAVQTGVTRDDQIAAIVVRSDGTIVQFWQEIVSGDIRIRYKIRSTGGTWGSVVDVDSTGSTEFGGVVAVLGASDKTHIFYSDITNSNLLHKALSSSDVLDGSPDIAYADFGGSSNDRRNMTNPVYWDDAGDEKIMVGVLDQSEEKLYSVLYTNDGAPDTADALSDHTVENNSGGNHMVIAHMAIESDVVYCVYGRLSSPFGIWIDENDNDGGWGTDAELVPDKVLDWILCSVIQHSSGNGSDLVVGFIYDDGSNGGCGNQWYSEYILTAAPTTGAAALNGVGSITPTAQVEHHASVDLQPFGDLVAEGFAILVFGATLSGSGSLLGSADVTGQEAVTASAVLAGAGTLTGLAEVVHSAAITLPGVGSITSVGYISPPSKAVLAGVATLTGSTVTIVVSGAVFSGVALLVADAISFSDELAQATLAGVATVIPVGEVSEFLNSGALLNGVATLGADGISARMAEAELEGVATLVALPIEIHVLKAVLSGSSIFLSSGSVRPPGVTSLSGVGSMVAVPEVLYAPSATFNALAQISAIAVVEHPVSIQLNGVALVVPIGESFRAGGALLSGVATTYFRTPLFDAVLSGDSGLIATWNFAHGAFASMPGAGSLIGSASILRGNQAVLSGTASLAAVGTLLHKASIQMNGAGTFIGTALRSRIFAAQLDGVSSLTALPTEVHTANAVLSGAGSLTALCRTHIRSAATLNGIATFAGVFFNIASGQVTLSGVGSILADGSAELVSAATFSGVANITPFAYMIKPGITSFAGVTTLTALPHYGQQAESVLSGTGAVSGAGAVVLGANVSLSGTATLSAIPHFENEAQVTLSGVGSVIPLAYVIHQAIATLSGVGSLTGYSRYVQSGAVDLAGVGVLSGDPSSQLGGSAVLAGVATIITDANVIFVGVAQLDGIGSISSFAGVIRPSGAILAGVADLISIGEVVHQAVVTLAGIASLIGLSDVTHSGAILFEGIGSLTAVGVHDHPAEVILSGVASMISDGLIDRNGAVTLSGTGIFVGGGVVTYGGAAVLDGETIILPDGYTVSSIPVAFSEGTKRAEDVSLVKMGSTDALTKVK